LSIRHGRARGSIDCFPPPAARGCGIMREIQAQDIANALGGYRSGSTWMARCPAHDDTTPSLAIAESNDGKVLVYCHAGCSQQDVIAALRARGLWGADEQRPVRFQRKLDRKKPRDPDSDTIRRKEAALAIWQESGPLEVLERLVALKRDDRAAFEACGLT
jgi:hypothetical protein